MTRAKPTTGAGVTLYKKIFSCETDQSPVFYIIYNENPCNLLNLKAK